MSKEKATRGSGDIVRVVGRLPKKTYWDFTQARCMLELGSDDAVAKAIELFIEYSKDAIFEREVDEDVNA